ncbi:hypothetical protein CJ030_MR5G020300 [Morella rubra]|uniref:F-box associated beta-propeller type 3 domain-containing protein n=1 Tax=Morella rubra TaxID=262757 RepID=A0A6A1VL70_9ROSI|nr:hypothetical protein CJ030_MR5G020318 [Morella rubra]KAB1213631.1 hypothetical protein CJ030_MR5G020300 [Morella rubra]
MKNSVKTILASNPVHSFQVQELLPQIWTLRAMSLENLHEDIIIEILLRLPVKSLVRFRSPLKELVLPLKQSDCGVRILGTCNGLVCVSRYDGDDFYIWNPSTADCRKLRDPWIEPSWDGNRYLHGFGYDLSSDDYKVVLVATARDGSHVAEAQVQKFPFGVLENDGLWSPGIMGKTVCNLWPGMTSKWA